MPKSTIPAAVVFFLLTLAAQAADPGAPRGQTIFESQCMRCHSAGPKSLKSEPERLRDALKSSNQHRFILSEDDLRELADYLRDTR